MTKKYYIEIARNIKNSVIACKGEAEVETLRTLVASLCSSFVLENPRFDSRRFTEACGLVVR